MGRFMDTSLERRNADIASSYRAGATQQEIGDYYGISRERVRQILAHKGLNGKHGGQFKRAVQKEKARLVRKNQRYRQRYGMTLESFNQVNDASAPYKSRPIALFNRQKHNAKNRCIEWNLTFAEWWGLWEQSGKWDKRGRGKGRYCMARHSDSGTYEVGNVKIIPSEKNNSEYIRRYWNEVRTGKRPPPKRKLPT